jgi:hypothetical protein
LTYGFDGKIEIKNIHDIELEFWDFGWKFYDFWIIRSTKIKWRKNVERKETLWLVQRALWVQFGGKMYYWVQTGVLDRQKSKWGVTKLLPRDIFLLAKYDTWHIMIGAIIVLKWGRICGPLMFMLCNFTCIRVYIHIFNNAYYFLKYLSY